MVMMHEAFMKEIPVNGVEERRFIENLVQKVQRKMNDEAFLVEDRARGDYSGCLIELEERMRTMLNPDQFAFFKEIRTERNAFPWPPIDVDK